MLSDEDKSIIIEIAVRYNVTKLYLFGSCLNNKSEPSDIDLAVEGIDERVFFKFYAELISRLSKPVDLVYLKVNSKFNNLIKQKGVIIHG